MFRGAERPPVTTDWNLTQFFSSHRFKTDSVPHRRGALSARHHEAVRRQRSGDDCRLQRRAAAGTAVAEWRAAERRRDPRLSRSRARRTSRPTFEDGTAYPHGVLPASDDTRREARISASLIKHLHDLRPMIARDGLQRLDDGTLHVDEVLPNLNRADRAQLVLNDAREGQKVPSHGVTVLEVEANGKGSMSTRQ